jgi:hypothetical protein
LREVQTHLAKLRGLTISTVDLLSDLDGLSFAGVHCLTEEKSFPRAQSAPLMRVRDLSDGTSGPVKVLVSVLKSDPGKALVQDIFDNVENAASIWTIVEGTLNVDEKYLLVGTVTKKKTDKGKEIRLEISIAHNVNTLDIKLYKEVRKLEERVIQALGR